MPAFPVEHLSGYGELHRLFKLQDEFSVVFCLVQARSRLSMRIGHRSRNFLVGLLCATDFFQTALTFRDDDFCRYRVAGLEIFNFSCVGDEEAHCHGGHEAGDVLVLHPDHLVRQIHGNNFTPQRIALLRRLGATPSQQEQDQGNPAEQAQRKPAAKNDFFFAFPSRRILQKWNR